MLFDLEPDRSVTGGAFYCDQEFESEFVDVLTSQCHKYLQNKVNYYQKYLQNKVNYYQKYLRNKVNYYQSCLQNKANSYIKNTYRLR